MLRRLATPLRLFALAASLCLGAYANLSAFGDFDSHGAEDTLYDRQERYRNQTDWESGRNPQNDPYYNNSRRQGRYTPYRSPYYNNNSNYYNNGR